MNFNFIASALILIVWNSMFPPVPPQLLRRLGTDGGKVQVKRSSSFCLNSRIRAPSPPRRPSSSGSRSRNHS